MECGIVVAKGKAEGYCTYQFSLCTDRCLRFQSVSMTCSLGVVFSAQLLLFCSQVRFRRETKTYTSGTHYKMPLICSVVALDQSYLSGFYFQFVENLLLCHSVMFLTHCLYIFLCHLHFVYEKQ